MPNSDLPEKQITIAFRIPLELHAAFRVEAKRVRRSLTQWLIFLGEEAVAARKANISPEEKRVLAADAKAAQAAEIARLDAEAMERARAKGRAETEKYFLEHPIAPTREEADEAQARQEADPYYIAMMERQCAKRPDHPASIDWRKRHPAPTSDEQEAADDLARILAKKMPPLGTPG